jgi:hypothetical protein
MPCRCFKALFDCCGDLCTRMLTAGDLFVALLSDGRDKQFGRTWHRSHWFDEARFPRAAAVVGDIRQVKWIWHHAIDAGNGGPSSTPRH